ncbi:MAG TPA: PLP-dependent aspartate aminotransferase family protein [Candidatus Angelobacter sp.]|nr:PLP-dependent aspartate aminotransferase family protein [Candidatus Angelobacter sp.]
MRKPKNKSGFGTIAIHVGQEPDPSTGAVSVPIFATSTYAQQGIGKHKGHEYARVSNPTRSRLEENLAALEAGTSAHVFSSGMAAITAVANCFLEHGDHVICGHNLYAGVPRLFNKVMAKYKIETTYVDTSDLAAVKKNIRKNTRFIFIETPSNPLMILSDIREISSIAHARGVEVIVDNTFMSPYFQQPIQLGADMVVHSTTKFLNGHSDGMGGLVVATKASQAEKLAFMQKTTGAILSPFECWLVLRGVKTLAVRMKEHEQNGRKIAQFLHTHGKVEKVLYPGLPAHPQHSLAQRQMTGFGALITIETGSFRNAQKMLRNLKLCSVGLSLGGVETLVCHPATMTHESLPENVRREIGITDGMVRISVGIEDADDIIMDLDRALAAI